MDQTTGKRTIKYLAVCKNPSAFREVIRFAPDSVIKSICNASLNALKGEVVLSEAQRKQLSKYRKSVIYLTSKVPLPAKRNLLLSREQRGGFAFVPLLLSAVIGSLGSAFLSSGEN
jgi:hypothetical protein